jgi:serine/threonine-protein kinase
MSVQPEFEQASIPFREGDIIAGKYEVIRLLGRGGMAFVIAARHIELDEPVALKFLRSEYVANADLVARFAHEARASVKIQSEHVARVFDVGALREGPFIVMEYLEGKDLAELLHEEGTLPVERAIEYVMQACEALAAAHAIGIVHRDVKPENLFLVRRAQGIDVIKLLDFGISKLVLTGSVFDDGVPLVETRTLMGTPIYMSPEQIRGSGAVDGRADIWSLGCVLFELLTGHAPFGAPSLTSVTAAILERPAPLLSERRPDLPAELDVVLGRCLEKDPHRRFQDIGELAAALYRLAPPRTRLSVERCSNIQRHIGGSLGSPELASVPHPPGLDRSNVSTIPQMAEQTTGLALQDVTEPSTTLPMARRSKVPIVAGACALLAAGGLVLHPSGIVAAVSNASAVATIMLARARHAIATASGSATADSAKTPPSFEGETGVTKDVVEAPLQAISSAAPSSADSARIPDEVEAPDTSAPALGTAAARKPKTPGTLRKARSPSKSRSQTESPEEIDVGF